MDSRVGRYRLEGRKASNSNTRLDISSATAGSGLGPQSRASDTHRPDLERHSYMIQGVSAWALIQSISLLMYLIVQGHPLY